MRRAVIITASDSGYRGEREDLSGPAVREILEKEGYQVTEQILLPDDREALGRVMAQIADEVGLGDASYLGKCLRARFGCTALELRAATHQG